MKVLLLIMRLLPLIIEILKLLDEDSQEKYAKQINAVIVDVLT